MQEYTTESHRRAIQMEKDVYIEGLCCQLCRTVLLFKPMDIDKTCAHACHLEVDNLSSSLRISKAKAKMKKVPQALRRNQHKVIIVLKTVIKNPHVGSCILKRTLTSKVRRVMRTVTSPLKRMNCLHF